MRLTNRLRSLERKLPADPDCPTCRGRRGYLVLVDCRRERDGSIALLQPLPAPCTACGQVAESIVKVVHLCVEGPTADGPDGSG
jgi:hypothetical protein